MTAFTPLTSKIESDAESRRERLREEQLEMLGRLAEVGLQIAEAIGRCVAAMAQAAPEQDDAPTERRVARLNAAAMAYARAARGVRMTLALQAKLAQAPAPEADPDQGRIEFSWMEDPSKARTAQTLRVKRIVRRVGEDADLDQETLERLTAEAAERLEDEDLYGDPLRRPMGEIIARICRDLGLDPDWARLAREPWAQDEIAAGNPASPFAPWMAGKTPPPPPDRYHPSP